VTETPTSWLRAIRGFDRNAYLLFATGGILGFTYLGITTLLSNLFFVRLGYGTEVIGNLNALFYLLHMAFSVPAGAVGMRFGSRRAMLAGGVIALAGWGIAPAASFLLFPDLRMAALVGSRVLGALGGALFIVNSNPALIGAVDPGSGTYAFAFNNVVVSISTFLGNVCGGLFPPFFSWATGKNLASSLPYGLSLWAAVACLLPGLAALSVFRETGRGNQEPDAAGGARAPLAIIALIAVVRFFREVGYGGVTGFFTVYLDSRLQLSTAIIGLLVSVSSIASVVFSPMMPPVARRWGTGRTSLAGLLVMAAGVLPIALLEHPVSAGIGWAGMTAANSMNEAAMQVYIMTAVAPRWRALMSGAANMATTLGLAASASAGGYAIGAWGYRTLFLISACSILASAAFFGVHLWTRARRGAPAES